MGCSIVYYIPGLVEIIPFWYFNSVSWVSFIESISCSQIMKDLENVSQKIEKYYNWSHLPWHVDKGKN